MSGEHAGQRTASIIAAAIKTASMTPHEMGEILGAIVGVICWVAQHEPELEGVAAALSISCEQYQVAEDMRQDRLYEESKSRA